MTATLEAHEHTWQLQSVGFDDGVSVQEFGCLGCGAVDYR